MQIVVSRTNRLNIYRKKTQKITKKKKKKQFYNIKKNVVIEYHYTVVIWWIASYSIKYILQTTSEKAVENWGIEKPWMAWIAEHARGCEKYKYIIIFKTKMFRDGRKKREIKA